MIVFLGWMVLWYVAGFFTYIAVRAFMVWTHDDDELSMFWGMTLWPAFLLAVITLSMLRFLDDLTTRVPSINIKQRLDEKLDRFFTNIFEGKK